MGTFSDYSDKCQESCVLQSNPGEEYTNILLFDEKSVRSKSTKFSDNGQFSNNCRFSDNCQFLVSRDCELLFVLIFCVGLAFIFKRGQYNSNFELENLQKKLKNKKKKLEDKDLEISELRNQLRELNDKDLEILELRKQLRAQEVKSDEKLGAFNEKAQKNLCDIGTSTEDLKPQLDVNERCSECECDMESLNELAQAYVMLEASYKETSKALDEKRSENRCYSKKISELELNYDELKKQHAEMYQLIRYLATLGTNS